MATGTEATILSLLMAHLTAMVTNPVLQIAYPNVAFPAAGTTKPANYLQASFMPNRTDTLSVGAGSQRHQGILQISVRWTGGQGLAKPMEVADQVIARFAKGTRLQSGAVVVSVTRKPWASGPMQEGDGVMVPVTIQYLSFNQ